MKQLLKNTLPNLAFFFSYLRYRLLLLLIVNVAVAFMDGLGLAMFLPMLELVADQDSTATTKQMGQLAFVLDGIRALGLQLNLTVVLLSMLFFFILKGIAKWLSSYLGVIYQQYFIRKIRVENIDALTNYQYEAFVKSDAGRIQNTLSGEAQRVVQAYRTYSQMMMQLMMLLTYAFLAFLSNPSFAFLVLIGGVITNFLFNTLYKKTKVLSKKLVKSNSEFQGLLIQTVAFFKYLKATGLVGFYAQNLKKKVYEIEASVRSMGVLDSLMQGVREPLMIGVVVVVILIQVNLLGGSLATIILSILFFYRALISVNLLQTAYNKFLSFSGSLTNMADFVQELKRDRERNGKNIFSNFQEKITVKNLSFGYLPGDDILKHLNLEFYKNETLALVGESGSGKTTLMNIISGLLSPSKGQLLIDGTDANTLDISSFQHRIGYITQEPVIFDDTVFNNVTFWAEKSPQTLQRFQSAVEKANILSFIREQADQENAHLGNNGINLSGGQKQRVSIARELYKEVDFLFMDEATSALDSETERAIQESIDGLKGQYTILIIAHRLSTIKNADRVIILNKGEIERIGSYQELIEQSMAFRRMVELQEL